MKKAKSVISKEIEEKTKELSDKANAIDYYLKPKQSDESKSDFNKYSQAYIDKVLSSSLSYLMLKGKDLQTKRCMAMMRQMTMEN